MSVGYQNHVRAIFPLQALIAETETQDQPSAIYRVIVVKNAPTSQSLKTMNFIAGLALLVMLFPVNGKVIDKPAGVRTAVELIDKRARKAQLPSAPQGQADGIYSRSK